LYRNQKDDKTYIVGRLIISINAQATSALFFKEDRGLGLPSPTGYFILF
jgi:hypothetical protein